MNTIQDLKAHLDTHPMKGYQWLMIAICILIYTIDGFDILVMAFTAHSISESWGLNGAQIGGLISSGLIGSAIGSFFVAPLGDKFGRKKTMVYSIAAAGIFMIFSAYAENAAQLGLLRLLTGIAIGGVLSNCNVLTSEYSSLKWRSLTVCMLSTGYALGATLGGILAIQLDHRFGWQSVFLIGGIVTLVTALISLVWIRESIYFLINRKPKNREQLILDIQQKLSLPDLKAIQPMSRLDIKTKSGIKSIFQPEFRTSTILLWIALFCMMFGFYYILTWTPKILASSGMSNKEGMSAGVLINFGAVIGTLMFGFLGAHVKIKKLQVIFLVLTAVLTFTFAFFLKNYQMALMIGLVVGIFGVGSKAGIQVVAPLIYNSSNRATGVGLAIGVGRVGSMLSPAISGILLDLGWTPKSLFIFASLFFLVSMAALICLKPQNQEADDKVQLKGQGA